MIATTRRGWRSLAAAGLAACATTGCLLRAGKLSPVPSLPAGPPTPLQAHVELDVEYVLNDETTQAPAGDARFEARFRNPVDRAVDASGYVSRTLEETADVDLQLHLEVRETGSIVSTALTMFSLYIIPTTSSEHYRLEAKLSHPGHDRVWRSSAAESSRRWLGLVFLPGSPFAWPPSVERGICEDLTRTVLRDLQRGGAFSPPAP